MSQLIKNIAWTCLIIGGVIIPIGVFQWFFETGSVNVVDMRGCVLREFKENPEIKTKIIEKMLYAGWSNEMVSYSFDCFQ